MCEVWPDNWLAVRAFDAMGTQWRIGYTGPAGLDYAALPVVMRMAGVPLAERADVFDSIRTMEDAALEQMRAPK